MKPSPIGAKQAPELLADELEPIDLDRLVARFELEDVQVCSASRPNLDAGSGRLARGQLIDVGLGESKLRGVELVDVVAERLDAANGDWGGGVYGAPSLAMRG